MTKLQHHSTKSFSNDLKKAVVNMKQKNFKEALITELTTVQPSTQRSYIVKNQNNELEIAIVDRSGHKNPNAKRDENFDRVLRVLVAENPS
jgi:predicted HAD superfamily phosphohydrolase YqeG